MSDNSSVIDKSQDLEKIAQQASDCTKCSLYKTATKAVPGAGNPEAEIVFIGEAPGYWEDQKGVPFVGAAGNLLNKLLIEIGMNRDDVYICNILKHRTPNNRDPQENEIQACTPYLKEQLLIIKPKLVITLGRFAMNYFLPSAFISKVHGVSRKISWQDFSLTLFPVYHPAAALRNGKMLEALRQDFAKIPDLLGASKIPQKKQEKKPSQGSLF
jgi:DNA polymerase